MRLLARGAKTVKRPRTCLNRSGDTSRHVIGARCASDHEESNAPTTPGPRARAKRKLSRTGADARRGNGGIRGGQRGGSLRSDRSRVSYEARHSIYAPSTQTRFESDCA